LSLRPLGSLTTTISQPTLTTCQLLSDFPCCFKALFIHLALRSALMMASDRTKNKVFIADRLTERTLHNSYNAVLTNLIPAGSQEARQVLVDARTRVVFMLANNYISHLQVTLTLPENLDPDINTVAVSTFRSTVVYRHTLIRKNRSYDSTQIAAWNVDSTPSQTLRTKRSLRRTKTFTKMIIAISSLYATMINKSLGKAYSQITSHLSFPNSKLTCAPRITLPSSFEVARKSQVISVSSWISLN
jgi:hypothetical protein